MGKSEAIYLFLESVGGIANSAEITRAGFLPGSISYALESGSIDKLTRGVYCTPEIFEDDFAAITYRWKKCVLSHGSALYLMGLSDRVPSAIDVTVPHGYNPHSLAQEYPDTKIHRVSPRIYELGIVTAKSPGGGTVKTYCAERAVADLISQRSSEGVDPQLIHDGIAGYFGRKDADFSKLEKICQTLGVEEKYRMYLEVLT